MISELFKVVIGLHVDFLGQAAQSLPAQQEHILALVDEMARLEDATLAYSDSDLSVDLSTGSIEVRMAVFAESLTTAVEQADVWVRTAIHGAGGHTAEWDRPDDDGSAPTYHEVSSTARLVDA